MHFGLKCVWGASRLLAFLTIFGMRCLILLLLLLFRRCDVIAKGVLNAAKNIGMKKPIIIRLKGTNVKEAKELIAVRSRLHFYTFVT